MKIKSENRKRRLQHEGEAEIDTDLSGTLELDLIEDPSSLPGLKEDWDRLQADQGKGNIFLSHAYVSAWWQVFGAERKLQLYLFRLDGEIIGIAPLMVEFWRFHGLPIRRLSFLQNHHTLRGDLLLPIHPQACIQALFKHLRKNRGTWDLLSFENVSPESALFHYLPQMAKQCSLLPEVWLRARMHHSLSFIGSWNEYLSTRSKNFRWKIKRDLKRMNALGDCYFHCVTEREEQRAWLERMFELERKSWKGNDANAAMNELDREFIRVLYEQLEENQLGPIWLIEHKGETVASLSTLGHADTLYTMMTYYAPEYDRISPGMLMMNELLGAAWSNPWMKVDFNGDTSFIKRWALDSIQHHSLKVYSGNFYSVMLWVGSELLQRLRKGGVRE
ncbi:MAG TPA: GNAT family N-acetyltransferase [Gammaproteobacteria bacterium]|nr:GNAT family N-acetyltransferase [Gammaproteobacteria bacterium]